MSHFISCFRNELQLYYKLRVTVLSESAIKHELCYLKRFDRYLEPIMEQKSDLTEMLLNGWIATLKGKSSSKENEIIVIRQFLAFLMSCGYRCYYPPVPKVREDYVPYIFSDEELELIFNTADNLVIKEAKDNPYIAVQIPVILRLLYSCGLRIGETINLKMKEVDLENGILTMIHTKGDKQRLVPMDQTMTDILVKYCMALGLLGKKDAWLFPSAVIDKPVSHSVVKYRFSKILKMNNIKLENRDCYERGPCLHCFRHVFAFKSFAQSERNGRQLNDTVPYLSIYLGHDSLEETSKYLKFSNEMYPQSIDAFGSFMEDILPEVDYEE